MNQPAKKIIGTTVPLFSLWTKKQKGINGTIELGLSFLDWLKQTKQSAWQMLPLHETHLEPNNNRTHVPSPYKGYGIGLDPRYLSPALKRLKPSAKQIKIFTKEQSFWLSDYAFFCALRDYFKTDDWTKWDADIKKRTKKSMNIWSKKLKKNINAYIIEQWQLHEGFKKIRQKAKKYNIKLIGDLSFYLPLQSPLVWKYQYLFQLASNGNMLAVSGLPDGPEAHFGRQVWGHPLYKWAGTKSNTTKGLIDFFKLRIRYSAQLFDIMRFDHAKGLYTYGYMDTRNNKNDTTKKGPGSYVFEKLIVYSNNLHLKIFAEDSGDNLSNLRKSLHKLNVPGIRLLRFGYNEKRNKKNKRYSDIANYPKNTFAYTTSHDTETLVGYLKLLSVKEKKDLCKDAGIKYIKDNINLALGFRNSLIQSPAHNVIIPMQDWLLTTGRINVPGTEKSTNDKNWRYRVKLPIEKLPKTLGF